ncbi:MAG: hypothetical protein M3P06_14630 [Acidobacteriota bacterium]|nr:hypothetical protein [Acidobacteriota bacterium]
MYKFIRMWACVAALLGTAAAASAATPGEFYQGLLRRGTASYEANRYTDAAKQLRIAAFGMVEAVDQYQLAQIYLTLTYDKLSDPDRAREAAGRVAVAERIERKYAGLPLPDGVRTAFETVAGKLLSPGESAMLLRGAEMSVPPQTTKSSPQTTKPATTVQAPPSTPRRTTAPPQTKPQTAQATEPRNTIPPPQTSSPENTAPQTVSAVPQRETPRTTPATQPAKPQTTAAAPQSQPVKPPQTTTTAAAPPAAKPAPAATTQRPAASPTTKVEGGETTGRGGPIEPPRPAAAAPAPRALSASEVAAKLASAERGINSGNLNDARRAYRELLGAPALEHETLVRVAEGLYRSRDFSGALSAFNRVGTLRRGEEPYRYYIAVALYETGDLARAKKELAAALPFIEVTPDVARYRTRIEGAQ